MKKLLIMLTTVLVTLGCVALTASAAGNVDSEGYATLNQLNYFIEFSGVQRDVDGNVESQDKSFFTGSVLSTTVNQSLLATTTVVYNKGVTTQADIVQYATVAPNEDDVFSTLKNTYESTGRYIRANTGEIISWDKFNSQGFRVEWYVFKYESGDGWHIDGRIIDKKTDLPIGIIDPTTEEKNGTKTMATCVEYDVINGVFIPGLMEVKENRPHSWAAGTDANDDKIVSGFDDVWYTVLNEKTFEKNNYVIPEALIKAAEEINEVVSARLSGLPKSTQYEYGRIDSQAWKKDYIKRNSKGTLWMTPYITEKLENAGITRDKYVWLAMGDTAGNITKVWVMDREMAGIDNLIENED